MSSRRLQLLAIPAFRWYVISCLLATFGGGLSYIAMSWLILKANDSVSAIAILMLCFWGPNVVLGPLLGVVADRYSRKWLMVASNGIRALLLMGFGVTLHYHLSAHLIYALMALLGVCFSIYLPAAIALVREIIPEEDLLYANSTVDIAYEVGNVVGMGSAGLFIALFSMPTAILINGIIFVSCTLTLMMVRVKSAPLLAGFNIYNDFKEGFRYLLERPKLIIIYCVQMLILVGFMTTPVLLAPFARNALHANVLQFGRIDAALSVGVVVGGLFIPWVANRWGLIRTLVCMCLALSVFFLAFAVNRTITGAEVLYFFIGAGLSVWPLIVTQAQNVTHLDFQARVQSIFNSVSGVLILVIYLLVGVSSHFISTGSLYGFEVLVSLAAVYLLWRNRRVFSVEG